MAAQTTGTPSCRATIAAPGCTVPGTPLRWRVPSTKTASARPPHRLPVGLAAPHREGAEGADEGAEAAHLVRLHLRQEVQVAGGGVADAGDVDPVEVVERDDETAAARNPLGPVGTQPGGEHGRDPEHGTPDGPDDVLRPHPRPSPARGCARRAAPLTPSRARGRAPRSGRRRPPPGAPWCRSASRRA